MTNATAKIILLLGALGGVLISPALHADDSMPSLLSQFKSPDPEARSVAFSSAVAKPDAEKKEAYEKALIALLKTETAYSTATPVAELQDDDEWNAYYKNLIITVAKLRSTDSIAALLPVMDKDDAVTQTLAGFGPPVLDAVIAKIKDANQGVRLGAVTVLFEMLNPENEIKITGPAVRSKIEAALKGVMHDHDPNIQSTAAEALKKLKPLEKPPESM